MSQSALRFLRVLGPLGAATALGIGTLPALAQTAPTTTSTGDCSSIRFELANPSPGSRVEVGDDDIQGIALDTRAPSGSAGIDRIDFFLDSRDTGGMSVGTVTLDMTAGPFGPGSFDTTVSLPNMVGGHDLFAYAHDSVTSQETVISVPIALGEDPSKAYGTTPPSSATEMCTPGSAAAATTTSPATPAPPTGTPSTTTTAVSPGMSTITFEVGNPSPGDTIHMGGYVVEGVAFDKSAQSGSGIDRIDVFLDNRDSGGIFLGQANFGQNDRWTATLTLPASQGGLHTLWFYAQSSVTGQETAVSVPVTIAP